MPERLYRGLYASRTTEAVRERPSAVEAIVTQAAARNAALGVTGLLLVHDDWFVQALEGPRRAVSDLLQSIGRDRRHAEMELIGFQPIDQRMFADWTMAQARYDPHLASLVLAVQDRDRFDPKRLEPVVVLMLLAEAARQRREAA